jgi:hypothetical protein
VFRLVGHPGSYYLKIVASEVRNYDGSLLSDGGVQLHLPLYEADALLAEDYLSPKISPPLSGDALHVSLA